MAARIRRTNRNILLAHIANGDKFVYDLGGIKNFVGVETSEGRAWLSIGLNAELRKMIREGLFDESNIVGIKC